MNNPQKSLAPIVFAINKSFVLPLSNALKSLSTVYSGVEEISVTVLFTEALTSEDSETLAEAVVCNWYVNLQLRLVPLLVESAGAQAEINHAAYLRLAIPHIFNNDRVVYLDADILFTKSPLDLLKLKNDPSSVIIATQDVQNPTLESGIAMPGWESLGLKGDTPYFNSGVMVINTKKWNEEKISEKAIDFVQEHPEHIRFKDQDALNYLLINKWQNLPIIWNYPPLSVILKVEGANYYAEKTFPLVSILNVEQEAKIIHFVGPDKPWKQGFPDGEITDLYHRLTN